MRISAALLVALAMVAPGAARADDVADFYRGKQIQMIIGYGPGGGYDLNARLLARHMGNFIPGNPVIVAQNMPGAGSARAASFVHSAAPKDGTVIGAVDRQVSLSAVLGGNPAIKFAARDINWLGTVSSYADDAFVLWVRKDAAAKSTADLLRPGGPEVKVGGSAMGSTDDVTVVILRDVTGMRLNLITGYPDGNAISLALERGEVEGRMAGLGAIASTRADWLRPEGPVRPFLQIGRLTRLPSMADVPTARELVRDDKGRSIIEAMELTYQVARPFMLPPGIPADRQAALRKAMMDAANSKAYREEAARMSLDISPIEGGEVGRLVAGMDKAPPEALAYLRKLLATDGQ